MEKLGYRLTYTKEEWRWWSQEPHVHQKKCQLMFVQHIGESVTLSSIFLELEKLKTAYMNLSKNSKMDWSMTIDTVGIVVTSEEPE